MLTHSLKVKLESVKKLVRRNAKLPLKNILEKLHPADTAAILKYLNELDRKKILALIEDKKTLANIIIEMEGDLISEVLAELDVKEIAQIVN